MVVVLVVVVVWYSLLSINFPLLCRKCEVYIRRTLYVQQSHIITVCNNNQLICVSADHPTCFLRSFSSSFLPLFPLFHLFSPSFSPLPGCFPADLFNLI